MNEASTSKPVEVVTLAPPLSSRRTEKVKKDPLETMLKQSHLSSTLPSFGQTQDIFNLSRSQFEQQILAQDRERLK